MQRGICSTRSPLPLRNKRIWLFAAALATPLFLAGCSHPQPVYYAPPPPPPPPSAYAAVHQQGFDEGSRAAQKDISRGLPPDLNRHPHFRQPPVAPPFINDFRTGFSQGYSAVMHQPPVGPGY